MASEKRSSWQSAKPIILGLGLVMVVGGVAWGIAGGVNLFKLVIILAGLVLLVVVWLGTRAFELYRTLAFLLLNTLVFVLLLEFAAYIGLRIFPARNSQGDERAQLTYFQNQDWGDAYWQEYAKASHEVYTPYVIWKKPPFAGELINVDEQGNRVTAGANCTNDAYTVFTFGGSAMWGDGVPDWGTIAAYLQTELDTLKDESICVVNLGQTAWVSTQEVIELIRQLQDGHVPNLVIFYDGGNDVGAAWEFGEAGIHFNVTNISSRFEQRNRPNPVTSLLTETNTFKLMERIVPSLAAIRDNFVPDEKPEFENEAMAEAIIQTYLANYHTIQALAAEYDFDYAFFWQPYLLYGDKPLTDEEQAIAAKYNERLPGLAELLGVVYPKIPSLMEENEHLYYFGDVLEDQSESLYIDEIHLTPVGNDLVAKKIVGILEQDSIIGS